MAKVLDRNINHDHVDYEKGTAITAKHEHYEALKPYLVDGKATAQPPKTPPANPPANPPAGTDGEGSDLPPADKAISKYNKKELVASLKQAGLEPGQDFDPEAKNDDLRALLEAQLGTPGNGDGDDGSEGDDNSDPVVPPATGN